MTTGSEETSGLRHRLVADRDLTEAQNEAIRQLLVAAFPQSAHRFSEASYYFARPDHRLWLETPSGVIVAHLDFEQRAIGVGAAEILVAGVGEVATHPDYQGRGLGQRLMAELRTILRETCPVDFGFLECRETVVGFYASVGWRRIVQTVREQEAEGDVWIEYNGPTLILPARRTFEEWPREGLIDLRGMPW